jgi:transposase InsO family protein
MAIWRRGQMRAAGAIHHCDQRSQYISFAFTRGLASEGFVGSYGHRRRRALDNAMCKSLIGTMNKSRSSTDTPGAPSKTSAPPSSNALRG